jgi:hypothetical protein
MGNRMKALTAEVANYGLDWLIDLANAHWRTPTSNYRSRTAHSESHVSADKLEERARHFWNDSELNLGD